MVALGEQNSSDRRPAPGFLLAPLGWVIDRLNNAIETEPALLGLLFDLGQARMHLIALALGDKVVLLYADGHRVSVRLTDSTTDLEKGLLSVASPLGKSVYGAEEGDEIEFQLNDGQQPKALIESVEKAMRDDAAAQLPETDTVIDLQGKVIVSQTRPVGLSHQSALAPWIVQLVGKTPKLDVETTCVPFMNHSPTGVAVALRSRPQATSDLKKVDRKMRSKWSRVLRFAEKYKLGAEPPKTFIKHRGGINTCATLYARRLGRSHRT